MFLLYRVLLLLVFGSIMGCDLFLSEEEKRERRYEEAMEEFRKATRNVDELLQDRKDIEAERQEYIDGIFHRAEQIQRERENNN